MRKNGAAILTAFVVISFAHQTVLACPSCFGDASSTEVQATKWAIAALLGVTGSVLVGVGSFFIYLRKRAHQLGERFSNRLN
jgi:hypothetical protein